MAAEIDPRFDGMLNGFIEPLQQTIMPYAYWFVFITFGIACFAASVDMKPVRNIAVFFSAGAIAVLVLPGLLSPSASESTPKPRTPKPSHMPSSSSDIDWSTIGIVIAVIATIILVAFGSYLVTKRVRTKKAVELKRKQVQESTNEARNRRNVQGLAYAELNGNVTIRDLKTLAPEELQKRVDAANMHSEEIFYVLQTLPYYEGDNLSRRDRRRRDQLLSDLRVMREQPEEVQRKALAGHTDQLITRVRAAVQSVRDLSEG